MDDRFTKLPRSLADQAKNVTIGPSEIPMLLAHPDWATPSPVVLWMHGRTAHKELDPGRYLRWLRAGIATCAVDLPGHGQRTNVDYHHPERTLDMLEQMVGEIDHIVEHLSDPGFEGVFDLDRIAIGGMSAGGMATLRRLCDQHPFTCAAVEGTTGNLHGLYFDSERPWATAHEPERVRELDPIQHLETFRPIPLLALHSESDEMVPIDTQRKFIDELRLHYTQAGADPASIEFITWPETGAPSEHVGFGRFANDAKNIQTDFLSRHLTKP